MIRQSQPTLLLTRPPAQSERFAAELGLPAVISPLLVPEFLMPSDTSGQFDAVVLSSETGVEAARRISAAGVALPSTAFCVGRRTAAAAARAGFDVVAVAANASALFAEILASPPAGPLLILRPEDSAAEPLENMISGRLETVSWVIYRQKSCELSPLAIDVLRRDESVLVPLFSPRSAQIFASEYRRIDAIAPLYCVAISQTTADAFDLEAQRLQIAATPDGPAMRDAVLDLLNTA